jgi:site-specific DNA-methyltransferase (adenine-specific)
MVIHRALFSSARTNWETPPALFAFLDREFRFTLDVCATRATRKCRGFFTPIDDGLRQRWTGSCWMNPPYGRAIARWVRKAYAESRRGARVVCLLPVRTDTAWWQDIVMRAASIRLLRGRITFVGAASPAPFPSAVVIFDHRRRIAPVRVTGWDWRAGRHAANAA